MRTRRPRACGSQRWCSWPEPSCAWAGAGLSGPARFWKFVIHGKSQIYSSRNKAVKKSHVPRSCRHTAFPREHHRSFPWLSAEKPSPRQTQAAIRGQTQCAASRPLRPSPGLWRGGHCLAASSWRLCLVLRSRPALGQSSRPAGSPKPGRPSTLSADGPQCWSCEPALGWRAGRVSSLRRSGLWRGHRRGSRATVSRPHACVRSFNARARVRLNPASSCPGASALCLWSRGSPATGPADFS